MQKLLMPWLRALLISMVAIGVLLAGMVFYIVHHTVVDFSPLTIYQSAQPSILLDDQGQEWARFQLDRREPISLDQMPSHLINAFLAAEDWQFFSHVGLSLRGIVRSSLVNLYHGRKVQGASTITQQLVKLLFFDSRKTFRRKIKEQLYALLIEQQCTKQQILQTYLNHIYFGCGIYGVEAASQRFWGISASQVSIEQAAVLASIMPNPGYYCPLLHPDHTHKRRDIVLHSMKKLHFIEQHELERALSLPITILPQHAGEIAPHLKEMIRLVLEEQVGRHQLYCGGLTIATTLNKQLQIKAEKSFKYNVAQQRATTGLPIDGSLLSLEAGTGHIKALVGGYDFAKSKFNRAMQARRQLGSIIKPLIYAKAIEQGSSFADVAIDEPIEIEDNGKIWAPRNHHRAFEGEMTLAYALSHSNNTITIKKLLEIGVDALISLIKKAHLKDEVPSYLSLALGCIDVTLHDAVGMFSLFAQDGNYHKPYCIRWVKDCWGTKIIKGASAQERVISSKSASAVGKVLEHGIERLRRRMQTPIVSSSVMSKTGTTNDSRTCWFIGATPELITGLYIGCDDNSSLGQNVYPITTAFPIWHELYKDMNVTKKQFHFDPSLKEIWIDPKTGKQVYHASKGAVSILV